LAILFLCLKSSNWMERCFQQEKPSHSEWTVATAAKAKDILAIRFKYSRQSHLIPIVPYLLYERKDLQFGKMGTLLWGKSSNK
jgi:hypothetical protein